MRVSSAERAEQLDAAHPRHGHVTDDDVDAPFSHTPLGLETIAAGFNRKLAVETAHVRAQDDRIVIDEQYSDTLGRIGPNGGLRV